MFSRWSFVNYWNDDFYSQWNHQIFFTITELYSTGILYTICDRRKEINKFHLFSIIAVGLIHMLAAGFDQFVINVIGGSGFAHQVRFLNKFIIVNLEYIKIQYRYIIFNLICNVC